MKVMFNGTVYDSESAKISIYDHGFMYGMGLIETFRTYDGQALLLSEHLTRLAASCQQLGIDWQPDQAKIELHIAELLAANDLCDGVIRLTVSAGHGGPSLPTAPYRQPNTIMYVRPLPAPSSEQHNHGIDSLQLLRTRRNTPETKVRLKSFHFMNNIIAKQELQQYASASRAEGLLLTAEQLLAEGIISNVFFIHDKILYTPHIETGILPGIARKYVLKSAHALGIKTAEGFYHWEDLLAADEVFITNSVMAIRPIVQVYDEQGRVTAIGGARGVRGVRAARGGHGEQGAHSNAPGPLTALLQRQYHIQIGGR